MALSVYGGTAGGLGDTGRYAGMPYDSPFATQGRMWTPMQIKFLMNTCKFYYLMNPLINAATTKMAAYPITEIIVKDPDKNIRDFYETFFTDTIDMHTHLIEGGLDYNVYGNTLSSVMFPFVKYLICKGCSHRTPAKTARFEFSGARFLMNCSKCNHYGECKVEDVYMKNPNGIRLVRWNPSDFQIHYSEITGEKLYQWTMPNMLRHDIVVGKRHVVSRVPQEFIQSVRDNKPLIFNSSRIFHMKRPSISSKTLGRAWGVPMVLPVLEDVFYLQVLRKAQEQIAAEHLVPLRILFPQGTGQGDSPYTMMNLGDWKSQIEEELIKFRRDRNYVPVLPVPVGNQTISGEGRALLLHQEIRAVSEQIIAGMGVPVEFVFGGLSYSGSSVSMRMLENIMLNYRQEHKRYMKWVVRQISDYMGWPSTELHLRDFRMADDLNRRQYLYNLWQAGLISDQALLEESGFDAAEQKDKRKLEEKARFSEQERMLLAQTEAQNKAARLQAMAQLDLQEEMAQRQMDAAGGAAGRAVGGMGMMRGMPVADGGGEAVDQSMVGSGTSVEQGPVGAQMGTDGSARMNIIQYAQNIATRLASMDPQSRAAALAQVRTEQPALAAEVSRLIRESSQAQSAEPLPEQAPPRRGAESALI